MIAKFSVVPIFNNPVVLVAVSLAARITHSPSPNPHYVSALKLVNL